MKLPDHMTIHCPDCGAEDQAPITYAWTLDGNRIQLTVNIAEDSAVAKHVLDRHLLVDAPAGVDPEAAPVVTDDSGRTHVVSRPVPLDHGPGGPSAALSGSASTSQAATSPRPDVHARLGLLLEDS